MCKVTKVKMPQYYSALSVNCRRKLTKLLIWRVNVWFSDKETGVWIWSHTSLPRVYRMSTTNLQNLVCKTYFQLSISYQQIVCWHCMACISPLYLFVSCTMSHSGAYLSLVMLPNLVDNDANFYTKSGAFICAYIIS